MHQESLFIFDYWYGPAVLKLGAESRQKQWNADSFNLKRFVRPERVKDSPVYNVNITLEIERAGKEETISEIHPMRYFSSEALIEIIIFSNQHNVYVGLYPCEGEENIKIFMRITVSYI